ncbi:hypothetical protein PHYPSEUDO_012337 [Phytophthora pseudosyringae]|uniref:Bzip transcription factor n=1 Tax=Phytophthora pseudosyringae TaxID=221518 RepID=A0A8T1V9R7_9STRA|nr:hypothetical protein PHYPSEUDO_012337 [Phytophthora pseudosyringae]
MNFCTLRPPNVRFLSDDVIGGVVQRRRPSRDFLAEDCSISSAQTYEQRRQSLPPPRAYERPRARGEVNKPQCTRVIPERDAVAVVGLLSLMTATPKRKRVESPTFSSRKSRVVAAEASTPQPETDTESLNSEKRESSAVPKWQDERQQTSPQTHHLQDDRISHLKKQTQKLREEIETFERQHRCIATALPAQRNGWDFALEYFKVFRCGLQSRGRSSLIKHTAAQLGFLRRTMSSDVVLNTGQGPDALLRSWKCISLWFQDVEVEQEGLDRGAAGSLVAVTRTSVTISDRTLRNVFPHLRGKNGTNSELAQQLLGQRIIMRGLTRFEWDSAVGCFTSVMTHSDLLTPLLRLLGNVEDVSRVFERSAVSPDFQWRLMV